MTEKERIKKEIKEKVEALKEHKCFPKRWQSSRVLAYFLAERFGKMFLWAQPVTISAILGKNNKGKSILPIKTAQRLMESDDWSKAVVEIIKDTTFQVRLNRLEQMSLEGLEDLIITRDREAMKMVLEMTGKYAKKIKTDKKETKKVFFQKLIDSKEFDNLDVRELKGDH